MKRNAVAALAHLTKEFSSGLCIREITFLSIYTLSHILPSAMKERRAGKYHFAQCLSHYYPFARSCCVIFQSRTHTHSSEGTSLLIQFTARAQKEKFPPSDAKEQKQSGWKCISSHQTLSLLEFLYFGEAKNEEDTVLRIQLWREIMKMLLFNFHQILFPPILFLQNLFQEQ